AWRRRATLTWRSRSRLARPAQAKRRPRARPRSPTGARWMPERRKRHLAAIDVKAGAAMESQSGLQMLRPRIYGAYETPSPPVDRVARCAAHEGRSHLLLRWIDPSLVDEHDGLSVDPALDMYDPARWADGAAAPPRYDAAFLARFMTAQRARRDRIEKRVRE